MPIVAAFCDSPRVRETLCVLLEHDCTLHFLPAHAPAPPDVAVPDLAVIATRGPAGLLRGLTARWPGLPIVTIDLGIAAVDRAVGGHFCVVPLEPHAIRDAVLHAIADDAETGLRRAIPPLVDSLRHEVTDAGAVTHMMAARAGAGMDAAAAGLFGTVMREQGHVLSETLDRLRKFLARPRTAPPMADFATMLSRRLVELSTGHGAPGIVCEADPDGSATAPAGPVALVPTLAALLYTHVRRRAADTPIRVRAGRDGIALRYAPRPTGHLAARSWPLLLAAAALQPCSWDVRASQGGGDEAVTLQASC